MRRAQSVIEYALVLGMIVMGFLGIQVYLARGVQGKFQETTDQMADQYGHGVSDVQEHSQASTSVWELTFPGWGSPTTKTWTDGSYSSTSKRGVASLDKNWP
ncbi:MAG: hypothetical protein K9L86_00180 [Candidatus Omnitrophica bacterium]|nr:hypothetical protein [Candidatus Omnitrophota bacterium]